MFPPLNLRISDELRQKLRTTSSMGTIIAMQGNTDVRARQLQTFLDGGKLNNKVMGALCRLLDNGNNKYHCKFFKPGLYEALSPVEQTGKTTNENKDGSRRYAQVLDIYQ